MNESDKTSLLEKEVSAQVIWVGHFAPLWRFLYLTILATDINAFNEDQGKKTCLSKDISLPRFNLHGTILHEVGVHLKHLIKHLRLVTHAGSQALAAGIFKVVLELILVVRVSAFIDCFQKLEIN